MKSIEKKELMNYIRFHEQQNRPDPARQVLLCNEYNKLGDLEENIETSREYFGRALQLIQHAILQGGDNPNPEYLKKRDLLLRKMRKQHMFSEIQQAGISDYPILSEEKTDDDVRYSPKMFSFNELQKNYIALKEQVQHLQQENTALKTENAQLNQFIAEHLRVGSPAYQ